MTNSNKEFDNKYYENLSYNDFMEVLKNEIGDMLRMMEAGKTVRYKALKARKKSIRVRKLLRCYRVISVEHDKTVAKALKKVKTQISKGKYVE